MQFQTNMDALLEQKEKQWERFIKTGIKPEEIHPAIAASWKRCRKKGLPSERADMRVLSPEALRSLLAEYRTFLDMARPIVRQLYDLIQDTQDIITIHTARGCVIDLISNKEITLGCEASNYCIGAVWTEEYVGTNAAQLCAERGEPIQVIGAEHYNRLNHQTTCYAAPIRNLDGRMIASLNVAGAAANTSSYIMAMTVMTAFAIEKQLRLREFYDILETCFDYVNDGAILTDNTCHVLRSNRQARKFFGAQESELDQLGLARIFDAPDLHKKVIVQRQRVVIPEYELGLPGKETRLYRITVIPIETEKMMTGLFFSIIESKDLNMIANEMAGNRAFYTFESILTNNIEMKCQLAMARQIATTNCSVLIESESGTGKELLAHSIHNASLRKNQPFVVVNCASLPHSLVESELFGYEKGAFTGALSSGSPGKFELADGGTIFLDEIGELPLEVQAKLLRVLDNHKVMRIGGKKEKSLNVRVVAATNRDLLGEVQKGNFREDLFYRINVLKFVMPPLRKRISDIPLLANHFLKEISSDNPGPRKHFSEGFMRCMEQHDWPGNIRELQNTVVKAFYMCPGEEIGEEIFYMIYRNIRYEPLVTGAAGNDTAVRTPDQRKIPGTGRQEMPQEEESPWNAKEQAERGMILEALKQEDQKVTEAAKRLGIGRSTMYRKIARYGISVRG